MHGRGGGLHQGLWAAAGLGPGGPRSPPRGDLGACRLGDGGLPAAARELPRSPRPGQRMESSDLDRGRGRRGVREPEGRSSRRALCTLRPTVCLPRGFPGPVLGSRQRGEPGRAGTPAAEPAPGCSSLGCSRLLSTNFPSRPFPHRPRLSPQAEPRAPAPAHRCLCGRPPAWGRAMAPLSTSHQPCSRAGLGLGDREGVLEANAPVWGPVCPQLGRQSRQPGGPGTQRMASAPP